MPEFNIRTDSVDVEQIMRQIRARIKEKRGVDYTEQQIQELANVKLERFLDPKGVRSDLVEQFKTNRGVSPDPPNYGFEDTTLYETHRGALRFMRKLLNPILKLFFNPNPLAHVLHMQGEINNITNQRFRVRDELDALYYEVIHNLVLETTRLGIEVKNLKMRLESLSSRMDFDERRARALEGVVQYRPGSGQAREVQPARAAESSVQPAPPVQSAPSPPTSPAGPGDQVGDATARRRRRRRRGRRGGRGRTLGEQGGIESATAGTGEPSMTPPHGDPTADAALSSEFTAADHGSDAGPDDPEFSGSDPDDGPDPSAQ